MLFKMVKKLEPKRELSPYQKKKYRIATLMSYMDYHLSLLSDALKLKDKKEIDFHKGQLDEIRLELYDLKFFRD